MINRDWLCAAAGYKGNHGYGSDAFFSSYETEMIGCGDSDTDPARLYG
jgi:hypothetical protein